MPSAPLTHERYRRLRSLLQGDCDLASIADEAQRSAPSFLRDLLIDQIAALFPDAPRAAPAEDANVCLQRIRAIEEEERRIIAAVDQRLGPQRSDSPAQLVHRQLAKENWADSAIRAIHDAAGVNFDLEAIAAARSAAVEVTPKSKVRTDPWNDQAYRLEHYRILRNGPIGKHWVAPARELAKLLRDVKRKFKGAWQWVRENVSKLDRLPMLAAQLGMIARQPVCIEGSTYQPNAQARHSKKCNTMGQLFGVLEDEAEPLSRSSAVRRLNTLRQWGRCTRERQYDREGPNVAGPFIPPQRKRKDGKTYRHCLNDTQNGPRRYKAGYIASRLFTVAPELRRWYNLDGLKPLREALAKLMPEAWRRQAWEQSKRTGSPEGRRTYWDSIKASRSERTARNEKLNMRRRAQRYRVSKRYLRRCAAAIDQDHGHGTAAAIEALCVALGCPPTVWQDHGIAKSTSLRDRSGAARLERRSLNARTPVFDSAHVGALLSTGPPERS